MRPVSMRLLALAMISFALVALGAGCGGDENGAFEDEVVAARDTADSAMAYIRRPKSTEDLVVRLRTNGERLATASGTIAQADAPDDMVEGKVRLATALTAMSKEMNAAANSIELVIEGQTPGVGPVETLVFDTWDTVQAALDELRDAGIDVEPLRPGGGP